MPTLIQRVIRKAGAVAGTGRLLFRSSGSASESAADVPGPVVSLTSYGKRVKHVHLTIESIARGTVKPSRLILWLDPADYAAVPSPLRRLQSRGLEIRETVAEWGPHKKYFPYCEAFADDGLTLVTADDDVLYPKRWLEDLMGAVQRHPDAIWAHKMRRIELTPDGALAPYVTWDVAHGAEPSIGNVSIGVGGVAYPPRFQQIMRKSGTSFMESCARTDDLWLHVHAVRHRIPIGQVREEAADFLPTLGSQDDSLFLTNQHGGQNDAAIAATYSAADVQAIREALMPGVR